MLSRCHSAKAASCVTMEWSDQSRTRVPLARQSLAHLGLVLRSQSLEQGFDLLVLRFELRRHVLYSPLDEDASDEAEAFAIRFGLARFLEGFEDEAGRWAGRISADGHGS